MAKKKDSTKKDEANVHEDLTGFNIRINEFGEIITTQPIDQLNEFLDRNVYDKKLDNIEAEEE